jgi:hypothetical protein
MTEKNEMPHPSMDVARMSLVDIGAHDSVTIPLRSIGLHRGANNDRLLPYKGSLMAEGYKKKNAFFNPLHGIRKGSKLAAQE